MKSLAIALAIISTSAFGQVHKCAINGEVVYQQTACPQGAESKTLDSGQERSHIAPISAEQRAAGSSLCVNSAPSFFKDPDSVRLNGEALYAQSERILYGGRGKTAIAHVYLMRINAKNSYGGYTGETNYWCYVGADFNRVINIVSSPLCTPHTCKGS